jgi:hypothetical protein
MKYIPICLFLISFYTAYCQQEKVHLDFDKYTCHAGDTVRFKAVIAKSSTLSNLSTNLYVQLYTKKGTLVSRFTFPIFKDTLIGQVGLSMGQVPFNDSLLTDNYYIVAFTRQQLSFDTSNLFNVPILVYNYKMPNSNVFHKRRSPKPDSVASGRIKNFFWITTIYQGQLAAGFMAESDPVTRKLQLIKSVRGDTAVFADISLSPTTTNPYALFPLDSTKEEEVLYLFQDSTLLARQLIHMRKEVTPVRIIPDTLDTSPYGYNSWSIQMPDTAMYYYTSISITDGDRSVSCPLSIEQFHESYTDDFTLSSTSSDTTYISFSGYATRLSGKKIKDEFSKDIVFLGVKDSVMLFQKVVRMDSAGNFNLDSMFFYGNIDLQFQKNKRDDGSTKDIRLTLERYIPPNIDSSLFVGWQDDKTPIGKPDTVFSKHELKAIDLAKVKTLQTVVVKGKKDIREELDHKYATGPFAEQALYTYDLRTDSSPYNRNIYLFLEGKANLTRDLQTGLIIARDFRPVRFYVDQRQIPQVDLDGIDFDRIAYIKILESDFLEADGGKMSDYFYKMDSQMHPKPIIPMDPEGKRDASDPLGLRKRSKELSDAVKTPYNVCIYMRQGTDYRTMRGGLNRVQVQGYSKLVPFTSDQVTLLWKPWEIGSQFRVRFTNNEEARRFRVKVSGITRTGKTVFFESLIE